MKRLALITALVILFSGFSTATQIDVQKMTTEPDPLEIGQYADVRFKVTNAGNDDVENLSVSFEENYPFSVDEDNQKRWSIASFESGDSYDFRVPVRVSPNAFQGEEELEVSVSEGDSSRTYEMPVELKADDDGLVVDSVSFPEKVGPGTSRTMNVTLENTANTYFRNVELSLNPGQDTPAVISGTSSRRIGSMESGEQRKLSYRLNVDESAENGVYSIPIQLDYENEAGASLSRSESTGIVVGGSPSIEAGLNDGEGLDAGSTGTATLRFVNRGEGTAKFVKIDVQGSDNYTLVSGGSVYLGDMSPDDYQTAEVEVYADSGADAMEIPVDITYQENGEERTVTQQVNVDILTSEERQLYGAESGRPVLPLVLVLIVLGLGIYYWRRKR